MTEDCDWLHWVKGGKGLVLVHSKAEIGGSLGKLGGQRF